jgi:hypothetical protein
MILTGPAGLFREQARVRADHVRVLLLAAEAAARHRLDHAQLLFGQPERGLERLHDVVRTLQRAERHERAVLPPGRGAVRLDVGLLLVRHAILAFDHDGRAGEAAFHVAALDREALEDGRGRLGIEDRRLLFVLDLDVGERRVGLGPHRMGHEQDRLHRVADDVLRESGWSFSISAT